MLLYNIIKLKNYTKIATYALKKNKVKIRKLHVTSTYTYYLDTGDSDSGKPLYYVVLGNGWTKCQAQISKNLYSRIYDNDSFYVISLSSPHGVINLLFFTLDYHIQEEFGQRYKFVEDTGLSNGTSNYKQDNSTFYREEIQQYSKYLKVDFKKYIYTLSFIAFLIFLAYLIYD